MVLIQIQNILNGFWEILTEFSQDERSNFIKFAWAQDRLPGQQEQDLLKRVVRNLSDHVFFSFRITKIFFKEAVSMNADEPNRDSDNPNELFRCGRVWRIWRRRWFLEKNKSLVKSKFEYCLSNSILLFTKERKV